MKKIFFVLLLGCMAGAAHAASVVQWWTQPEICRPNPTKCYIGMGAGYDAEMWDSVGNCWGMKMVCPDALVVAESAPVPMPRNEIEASKGIKADYDVSVLDGDCFGVRRTSSGGAQVAVNGQMVNVWCNGVLNNVDETVGSGEISLNAQPTCADLARNGWVAVLNQRCYGKYYDPAKYYIECGAGNSQLPARIVVLNGADYVTGTSGSAAGADAAASQKLFDKMISVSSTQRAKYYAK